MAIYLTSDWHFGHQREFIWGARNYSSVEEMNEDQIDKVNSLVKPEDDLYVLGDLMLGDTDKGMECIKRLMVIFILFLAIMILKIVKKDIKNLMLKFLVGLLCLIIGNIIFI